MRSLAPGDIVTIWEEGQRRPDWRRALVILGFALPDVSPEALSGLSIGQRNAHLFALRRDVVGPVMVAVVTCPRCKEQLQFEQVIAELLDGYEPPAAREFLFEDGEHVVVYRPLASDDIAAASGLHGAQPGWASLIPRAVVAATRGGEPLAADDLPAGVVDGIAGGMAAADPLAQVSVALLCAACENVWNAALDIVAFFWAELEVRGRQALADVVTLARHYGWSEADILAMSPARRTFYLDAIE